MDSSAGPKSYAPRRKAFWESIERRAGSRREIAKALNAAGYSVAEKTVGFWIRGDADPGLDLALWASARWGVSLDELARPGEEANLAQTVARHDATLSLVVEHLLHDPAFEALVSRSQPVQEQRRAG